MSVKELQKYTFVSKYARYNESEKRRETWREAVHRMRDMHLRKHPGAREEIEWAFDQVEDERVLGAQRALQFGGTAIERNEARIYNCWSSYCDRLRFFQESLFLLLAGGGVGFSVQKHHVAKLPGFCEPRLKCSDPVLPTKVHVVADSIEGWADAVGVLMSSYFEDPIFPEYYGCNVEFDYSQVRKAGSKISSGTGKAPGPEPLRKSIEKIRKLLDRCLAEGLDRLRPIHAYDIVMHASDAVLSGGVRRSATIAVFSLDDEEMMTAKTGNWFYENPQRARSNNSVLLLRSEVTREQFLGIIDKVRQFGEPGFLWADSTEFIVNPCVEIGMFPVDFLTLRSGWQACNLTTINGKKCRTRADFFKAVKAAAIIGTLQASYTKFPYLGDVSERICQREALLGVSITGIMESPDILLDDRILEEGAALARRTNRWMAKKLGINPAARVTCVKPEGTASCLLGTASGVHLHHARRFFRRVQANALETPYQYFALNNPLAVEKSVWSASGTDGVITFCCEAEEGALTKADMGAVEFLSEVRRVKNAWVDPGKDEDLSTQPWLSHNVSNTVNVRDDEWDEVANYIYDFRGDFAGISLLPMAGDLDYPQAPFAAVRTMDEIREDYGNAAVDHALEDRLLDVAQAVEGGLWSAIDVATGKKTPSCQNEVDFGILFLAFAIEHHGQDTRRAGHCLKELANSRKWDELAQSYLPVDYTLMVEDEDATNVSESIACAGGLCSIL